MATSEYILIHHSLNHYAKHFEPCKFIGTEFLNSFSITVLTAFLCCTLPCNSTEHHHSRRDWVGALANLPVTSLEPMVLIKLKFELSRVSKEEKG